MPYRGKAHFGVYDPAKPTKYGIKTYQLCHSSNDFSARFEIYTGVHPGEPSGNGQAYYVVFRLVNPYLYLGHILYMGNYYSSPKFFGDLLDAGTAATGTAKIGKEFRR